MSQHQFCEPKYSVVERHDDNSLTPFPNKQLNDRTSPSDLKLDSVLGIRTDANGVVWMLDNGMRSGVAPKPVGWDTKADKLHRVIYLPIPVAPNDEMTSRTMPPFESMDAKAVLAETSKVYCEGKALSALTFTGH
jgi:hypothetical protein